MSHLQNVVVFSWEGWKKKTSTNLYLLENTWLTTFVKKINRRLTHKRQSNIIIQKSKIDNSRWRTWSWKNERPKWTTLKKKKKKKENHFKKWNEPYKIPKWTKPTPTPTKIISFMYNIHIISPLDNQLLSSNISQ